MPKQLYKMFRSDFIFFQTIFGPFWVFLGPFWGVVSILSATVNNKVIRLRPPSLPTMDTYARSNTWNETVKKSNF